MYISSNVSKKMIGAKIYGIPSISTNPLDNSWCIRMSGTEGTVCQHCYSIRSLKTYHASGNKVYSENFTELQKPLSEVPFLNYAYFRFHANGELGGTEHFRNFVRIAEANPHCTFTLWTKRHRLVSSFLAGGRGGKPENLILIYSSPKLNVKADLPKWFDKVFTVYDQEHALEINCRQRCIDCLKCYQKNGPVYINEVGRKQGGYL